jgi:hypothetical protein
MVYSSSRHLLRFLLLVLLDPMVNVHRHAVEHTFCHTHCFHIGSIRLGRICPCHFGINIRRYTCICMDWSTGCYRTDSCILRVLLISHRNRWFCGWRLRDIRTCSFLPNSYWCVYRDTWLLKGRRKSLIKFKFTNK